jgi:ankyrin repeat protein
MKKSISDEMLIAIASCEPVTWEDIAILGADLDAIGNSVSRTPLMAASFAGRSDLIISLIENGATVNRANADGMTALHEAAAEGKIDAVNTLNRFGANIESETRLGHTPLMVASAWGNCAVISWGSLHK